MSEDINFGAITEALNDKADRDLNNTNPVADYVVERYDDEQGNWYEVWKSGKLRQGGFFGSNVSSWTNATINYMKPFSDTKYSLVCMGNWSDAQNSSCKIIEKTATSATVTYANNLYSVQPSVWTAEGKGA